jgi:RNA polymerase primary sigma factor
MPKSSKKASSKPSKPAAKKSSPPAKKKAPKPVARKAKPVKAAKVVKPSKSKPKATPKRPAKPEAKKATKKEPKSKPVKASKPAAKVVHGKNGKTPHKEKEVPEKKAPVPKAIQPAATPISVIDQPDVQDKLRDLIKLAKEQGYLTFDDLNEALPDNVNDPDEMETIMSRLRTLEIEIIEASDVDRFKDGKKADDQEEEEEKPETKLDILDDPVRMYLKQMGQVPLLTREQEVEISKRIEEAELNVQKHINRFGFIARAYLDLAQKLQEGRERFDRVILDKKIESRERYMKALPKLCAQLDHAQQNCATSYKHYLAHGGKNHETKSYHEFRMRSSASIRSSSSSRR